MASPERIDALMVVCAGNVFGLRGKRNRALRLGGDG